MFTCNAYLSRNDYGEHSDNSYYGQVGLHSCNWEGRVGAARAVGMTLLGFFPWDCWNFNMLGGGVIMLKYALHCYCATTIIMHSEMWGSTDAAWGNLGLDYCVTGFYRLTCWWLISVPEESVSSLVVVLQTARLFPYWMGLGLSNGLPWVADLKIQGGYGGLVPCNTVPHSVDEKLCLIVFYLEELNNCFPELWARGREEKQYDVCQRVSDLFVLFT